ncbi:MAG TPA: heparan-alpha-glucosaminide N-acetyltransferase domain-containing protein, partial [Flavisolibacter sp.]
TSVFLQGQRKSKKELSGFLIKRGLWLLFVEIIIMSLILSFDPGYSNIFLQVIWATGISMIVLGLMIWLPFPVILAVGLLIVFGHNALDAREAQPGFDPPVWYELLHRPAYPAFTWNGHNVVVLYPFLPWIGVMLLGYCLGKLFRSPVTPGQRRKTLTLIGIGVIALFILLRAFNTYGNPQPWSEQKDALFSFFSFVNTQKYPPSLLFLCMTIGPALLFLAWAGEARNWFSRVITVYGRVPFFYYILHFFLIHLLSAIFFLMRGHSFAEGATGLPGFPFRFAMPGEGFDLWVVYLLWLGIVVALYPACKWFSEYKRRNRKWWVSYL